LTVRVAFVLPSLVGGGAERVILQFAAHLDRARFDPSLVLLDGAGPLREMIPTDLNVIDLKSPRLRSAVPHLIKALRRQGPHAIVSTFGYVNLVLLACRAFLPREVRLVLRDANMPGLYLPNVRFGRIMRLGYQMLYKRADRIICSSERMAAEFAKVFGVPPGRLTVIRNPVDVAVHRQAAARPLRAPGNGLRFVAAGHKIYQKGFDRLLDMIERLPSDTHLSILGANLQDATLANRVAQLRLEGRVALRGFDPNPWPYYAGADAFLLPSRWEGMPNAALEALACGTPVIATPDAGGIVEVADQAPDGAVTIAASGAPFLQAMRGIRVQCAEHPRESLLPDAFNIRNAVADLENLLLDATSSRLAAQLS
jgi:glycosyltransferase involved in cell wall biosynthesis